MATLRHRTRQDAREDAGRGHGSERVARPSTAVAISPSISPSIYPSIYRACVRVDACESWRTVDGVLARTVKDRECLAYSRSMSPMLSPGISS